MLYFSLSTLHPNPTLIEWEEVQTLSYKRFILGFLKFCIPCGCLHMLLALLWKTTGTYVVFQKEETTCEGKNVANSKFPPWFTKVIDTISTNVQKQMLVVFLFWYFSYSLPWMMNIQATILIKAEFYYK